MIIIEVLIFGYLFYIATYVLFFGFGGFFYKKTQFSSNSNYRRFAILVPGYKEDSVIINTVTSNLKVDYPSDTYDLFVIADSFQPNTLEKLKDLDCKIIEVSFKKSTKVKALKKALELVKERYDSVVILDADNVIEEGYLKKVNDYLQMFDYQALQTQRVPKNKNNDLAILDGISESINNHIYRQGASATGFSASLNGSGMVFDFNLFKRIISQMDSIGGFDRELEFRFLEEKIKVKYLKEAKVFDEKTDDQKTFQNQRTRWISSQYVYLRRYFWKGLRALTRFDLVYFHSTVWRNIQLPRLINIGLINLLTSIAILLKNYLSINLSYWVSLWVIFTLSTLISIPKEYYGYQLITVLKKLPNLFLTMLRLMFKLKGANKKFIHTPHKAK